MPENQVEKLNPVLGRMIEYLHFRGIALTNADMQMRSGYGRLGKMVKNNTVPKIPFIDTFIKTFEDVDGRWLNYGDGHMLKSNPFNGRLTFKSPNNDNPHDRFGQNTLETEQVGVYLDPKYYQKLKDILSFSEANLPSSDARSKDVQIILADISEILQALNRSRPNNTQ